MKTKGNAQIYYEKRSDSYQIADDSDENLNFKDLQGFCNMS